MQQFTSQLLPENYAKPSLQGVNSTAIDFAGEHLPNAILHEAHIITAKQCDVTGLVDQFYEQTQKWVGYECVTSSERFVTDLGRRSKLTNTFCAFIQQTPPNRWTKKNSMLHTLGIVVNTEKNSLLVLEPLRKGQLTLESRAIVQHISQTLKLQVTKFNGFQTRSQFDCLRQVIQMFRYIALGHIVTGDAVILPPPVQRPQAQLPAPAP